MKARKSGFVALVVALGAAAVTLVVTAGTSAGPVSKHQPQATIKAAWIYVGPHNDGGWSQAHDKGRLFAQKASSAARFETTYKENVPEGPQTCQVIESLVRDGNKIIFATSFGFQACMVSEAKKHPDVYFEQATGITQPRTCTSTSAPARTRSTSPAWRPAPPRRRARSATSSRSRFPR